MKAFAIRFLIAAVLAFSLSGVLAADTIKVAFVSSLSGPFALQGEETMKNIAAAVDLVKSRGGVIGGCRENTTLAIQIVRFYSSTTALWIPPSLNQSAASGISDSRRMQTCR